MITLGIWHSYNVLSSVIVSHFLLKFSVEIVMEGVCYEIIEINSMVN